MHWFEERVRNHEPVAPSMWIEGSLKVNALMQNFNETLIEAEMRYRRTRAAYIEEGQTAAAAESKAKASDVYEDFLRLKAEKERISEFIMLSKKYVTAQDL